MNVYPRSAFLTAMLVISVTSCQAQSSPDIECASTVTIADPGEPGSRMVLGGRVLDYRGQPLALAAVVAHHTDHTGRYVPESAGHRIPRLRGVAVTDSHGVFCFSTIRPAAYPGGDEPAHVHLEITAPVHHRKWVTVWFDDDPLVGDEERRRAQRDDEVEIVKVSTAASSGSAFTNDIRLRAN